MIDPIVNTFLWRWSLRAGCMIIAVIGMIVATLTLMASMVQLTLEGLRDDEYSNMGLLFFIFFSAYLVVDFTFHMLIYFAAKRNDARTLKICCLFLAVRFIIDVIYVIIIFAYQDYNYILIIILAGFSVVRAYFFIVVFSYLAQLLSEIEAASQVAPEIDNEDLASTSSPNRSKPVVGITSDGLFTKEDTETNKKGILLSHSRKSLQKSVTIILPSDYVEKPPKQRRRKSMTKKSSRNQSFSGWSLDSFSS